MNLVKWFRRNNKKVMAVVVIVIMFGFIGGSTLMQLSKRRIGSIARFAEKTKITDRWPAMNWKSSECCGPRPC